ncbi:MAG: hypothetical protein KC442_05355 [Thermomicrobiales bacterium]|nr:hypothetical protein [Thermomicrobiales bacterium]
MTTRPQSDHVDDQKVIPFRRQEEPEAAALAEYWDATLRGDCPDPRALDPELAQLVSLLRHYHAVAQVEHTSGPPQPALPRRQLPVVSGPLVGLAASILAAAFVVAFVGNTLLSPRSWLLSSAADPDWLPLVSDDWLGRVIEAGQVDRVSTALWSLAGVAGA